MKTKSFFKSGNSLAKELKEAIKCIGNTLQNYPKKYASSK